jgi:hypothetical protein
MPEDALPSGDVEYDRQTDTYRTRYDWASNRPSTAAVHTVAAVGGEEPTEMPPLFEWVDPDALDRLFDPESGVPSDSLEVSFRYRSYDVSVRGDGVLAVRITE